MNWVFDIEIEVRPLATEVVEAQFPEKHYGDIMVYEAWSMRCIMENLIEIALQEYERRVRSGTEVKKCKG